MDPNLNTGAVLSTTEEQQRFITKVFGWMSFALIVSGLTSYFTFSNSYLVDLIFGNRLLFFGLLGFELILVIFLSGFIKKISANLAIVVFILYSLTTGLTLSVIFFVYTLSSIITIFFVTSAIFILMSLYGYFTKKDLTTIGSFLIMALLGLVIASFTNLFLNNTMLDLITTYAGILIFIGLTAYDTQKIKNSNILGNEGTDEDKKEAVFGALTLYLDFINLFLKLLRAFGKRK